MSMNNKRLPDPIFSQPHGSLTRIEKIWAYVALDPKDGNEGIISMTRSTDGLVFPLIASDQVRADQYRSLAQQAADEWNVTIRLVEFTTRTEVEVMEPKPK
jgi:hypothetical protein